MNTSLTELSVSTTMSLTQRVESSSLVKRFANQRQLGSVVVTGASSGFL